MRKKLGRPYVQLDMRQITLNAIGSWPMRRLGVVLGTVAVAALVMAGCGGSGDSSSTEATASRAESSQYQRHVLFKEHRAEAEARRAAVQLANEEVEEARAEAEQEKEASERQAAAKAKEAEAVEREEEEAEAAEPGAVSKTEYGNKWPLTVSSGTLSCEGSEGFGSVVFTAPDGTRYGLNGTAQDQLGLPPIDPIWRDDPELKEYGLKINIGPLLDQGLALCE